MLAFNRGSAVRPAVSSRPTVGIVVVVDGRVVAADAGARRLVGAKTARDVIGRDLLDFVAPGWADPGPALNARPELATVVRLDGDLEVVEWSSTPFRRDGREAIRLSIRPLAGDPVRIREIATGLTGPIPEAVIAADTRFGIRSFSAAAEDLYGISETDALGRCLTDVVTVAPPDTGVDADAALDAMLAQLRRTGHWHGRVVQRRSRGGPVGAYLTATVVRDAGGKDSGTVWVVRPEGTAGGADGGDGVLERLCADDPLGSEVLRALARREFVVRYQPIVALDTDDVIGLEAGLHWRHPDRGLLPPGAFPVGPADAGPVAQLLLAAVARDGVRRYREGRPLRIAVTLSATQMNDVRLPGWLAAAHAALGPTPGGLSLQVPETVLATSLPAVGDRLRQFDALGVAIAIDDFGAGYSSVASLRRLPIRRVKAAWRRICPAVMGLADELGADVVATGIDSAAALEHVRRLGGRFGQGPHLTSGAGSPA